jgi:hypothetical protein
MGEPDSQKSEKGPFRSMTPAHIREPKEADYVEVVFLESARFYRLFKKSPIYHQVMKLLRDAIAKKLVVQVRCASDESNAIVEVQDRDSPGP